MIEPGDIRIDTSRGERRPPAPAPSPARSGLTRSQRQAIAWFVGVGLMALVWWGTGMHFSASQIAGEMEEQYQLLLDTGASQMELGVRAGAVAEAYLHAQDRERYVQWNRRAQQHLRRAGLPPLP